MKLVVGLGNPEEKYKNTRHNAGYLVIEKLKNCKTEKLENWIIKKTNISMNTSGEAAKKLVEQYGINSSELWVIHDDLDIPLGSFKIQKGIGPKVHNGVNSVEGALGTSDFWRVRVGVDSRNLESRIPGEQYVLQDFSPEEMTIIEKVGEEICKKLATF